ncbi:MAG: hypothetical protein U0L88_00330 [Acutalibacteraceae bacterium]|nr:hypothetical protein [Acutalibacteraceae bacterium]
MADEQKILRYEELNDEERRKVDEILESMLECNQCNDIGAMPRRKWSDGLEKVDEYMRVLPGADYVLAQTLNYMFSNGLTTGSIRQDEVLDKFLYAKNGEQTTNKDVLRNTIGMATTHGASGLRWLNGNLYQYKWGTYKILTIKRNGIKSVLGYLIAKDGGRVPPIRFDFDEMTEYDDFLREIDRRELILLDTDDFMVMRNDTSLPYGHSPLLRDEARLDLLTAVYERLNYDIRYDGPGRIIIRPKDGLIGGDDASDASTANVIQGALNGQLKNKEQILAEAKRVANQIKNSSSDSVIVLSNAFDKDIDHLERVTKATEFFTWIKNDTLLLAQDFGMAPSLLELGGVSGNVSMTSIIATAMRNTIVPLREKYSEQFSSFISKHLGVEKIYFNKYEMVEAGDVDTMRTKYVNMLSLLNAMRVDGTDGTQSIQPKAQELFDDMAEMLSENIHNETGALEELTMQI